MTFNCTRYIVESMIFKKDFIGHLHYLGNIRQYTLLDLKGMNAIGSRGSNSRQLYFFILFPFQLWTT